VTRSIFAILCVLRAASVADAQSITSLPANTEDHAVVFELGWAGDWSRDEGLHAKGGTFAFEVTPIEHWLELEIGVTVIHGNGSTEVPVDVLFKKPWPISPRFEFMVGIGPEWIHATGRESGTFWGLSSVLDFMFWPRKNVGWYLEPGYELTLQGGLKHHGVGIAAGLLLGR
jgi:hypothetical protein